MVQNPFDIKCLDNYLTDKLLKQYLYPEIILDSSALYL